MDATRAAAGNDLPWRGRAARTWKHYVISPDPRNGVSLDELRELATAWVRRWFPDCEVAVVYHDDNAGRIPHAHVVVSERRVRGLYALDLVDFGSAARGDGHRRVDRAGRLPRDHGLVEVVHALHAPFQGERPQLLHHSSVTRRKR